MTETLKVLTFNTWMLRTPFGVDVARHIDERAELIPKHVAATGADIIALQEVWDGDLRARLEAGFRKQGYAFSVWRAEPSPENEALAMTSMAAALGPLFAAHSRRDPAMSRRQFVGYCGLFAGAIGLNAWGAGSLVLGSMRRSMGNGLLIVSRYPIDPDVAQLRFSMHTRADETVVLKGAIRATIQHPRLGAIDIFNSHLGAVTYEPESQRYSPDECASRLKQTRELVQWMREQNRSKLAFLALDLNADYRDHSDGRYQTKASAEYALISEELGWNDSYRALHAPGALEEITDDSANPYKAAGHFKNAPDCVIDYVFHRPHPNLRVSESHVVFKEAIPGAHSAERLSDHYGVLSHFQIA